MLINNFKVDSPSVEYQEGHILSSYSYASTDIKQDEKSGAFLVSPKETRWTLRTDTTVPKLVSVVFLLARPHTADNLMAGTWQCTAASLVADVTLACQGPLQPCQKIPA